MKKCILYLSIFGLLSQQACYASFWDWCKEQQADYYESEYRRYDKAVEMDNSWWGLFTTPFERIDNRENRDYYKKQYERYKKYQK